MSKLNSKLYSASLDQSGREIQFDIREDEEQQKKLQEALELLVVAGYFRARIKGLSAFDKIVGGMTWCITTCNFDVDVDLLFQESSTIGQKITLTERIVSVLPRMKCPHLIEPHQIQGFDFKNIYPVIQWLVKKAIETRAEMGDLNRSFALSKFSKIECEKSTEDENFKQKNSVKILANLKEQNNPQRKYKKEYRKLTDKHIKIQSTLLEYDQKNNLLNNLLIQQNQSIQKQSQEHQLKHEQQIEENNLKKLINEMSEADNKLKLTASSVGQLLGLVKDLHLDVIDQLEKNANVNDIITDLHHKQRVINIISKQIEHKEKDLDIKKQDIQDLIKNIQFQNQNIKKLKDFENHLITKCFDLEKFEQNTDKQSIDKLQQLVAINDKLKQKEQDVKRNYKEKLLEIDNELNKLKEMLSMSHDNDEKSEKTIDKYESIKAKVTALKLKNAKKNREISVLKRKIDEIPSRVELSQYQKRFIELYNQMSNVHSQTKQFYILYNVLEDKKLYMNKEINLLNSIHDQFKQAMLTSNNREQFFKQLEIILDGIKQNLNIIDNKKTDEKLKCDELNDKLICLIENKRIYYKTLKDFQEECKRNIELIN